MRTRVPPMSDIQAKGPRRFSTKAREDLGDVRLVLDTAAHNVQAAAKNPDPAEAVEALETALTMAEQAVSTMRRVRESLA